MLKLIIYISSLFLNPIPSGNRLIQNESDTSYNYCINLMKKYEVFKPTKYHLFKENYIGYGHLITKVDTLYYLTEKQSENLLKSDFNKNLKIITKKRHKLPYKKRLTLAMLSFNIGIGKVLKSGLIDNDSTYQSEYLKYSFVNGKFHNRLNQRRKDEIKLLTTNNY